MRQRPHRDVIDAGAGNFQHIRERDVARRFEFCPAGANGNCLAHHCQRHIIKQNSLHTQRQRFAHVIK
jgi:hypothetical protein